MGDTWTKKLDPYSRRALAAGVEQGLDLTVRLHDAATAVQLVESGLEVQATIGELVVGHVRDAATLIRIAELPCVAEVQASRTLHNEKE